MGQTQTETIPLPGLDTDQQRRSTSGRRTGLRICDRDQILLRWIGEQYTVRTDLLGVLMARLSDDPPVRERGTLAPRVVTRRVQAWREAGLVRTRTFLMGTASTVWLTADGMAVAGLPWRTWEQPTLATVAHRHAVGLVRAEAETMLGVTWVCERELREGQGGRPLHLPDGVVESIDRQGKKWRTAVEVELTRKTEARVAGILRHLLAAYDDVVYRAASDAGAVVTRAAAVLDGGERVHVRPFPPPALAAIA
jgi:hypothetical protein